MTNLNYRGHTGELRTILDKLIYLPGALERKGALRQILTITSTGKNIVPSLQFLMTTVRTAGTPHWLQSLQKVFQGNWQKTKGETS